MTPATSTPSKENAPASLVPTPGSAARADWYISLKTTQGKWMELITVNDQTREQAEKHAKDALRYYEGTTDWRVSLTPNIRIYTLVNAVKSPYGWGGVPPALIKTLPLPAL